MPPPTSPARTGSASPLAGAATESPSVPTVQTRLMQSAVSGCLVAPGARANNAPDKQWQTITRAWGGKKGSPNTCVVDLYSYVRC